MNRLKLNGNKTKLLEMIGGSVIKINNETIEKVNGIKYLGFIIDKDLQLSEYTLIIYEKNWVPKTDSNKISIITAINIYYAMIKPLV